MVTRIKLLEQSFGGISRSLWHSLVWLLHFLFSNELILYYSCHNVFILQLLTVNNNHYKY